MKSIQHTLPFSAFQTSRDPAKVKKIRQHLLIKGRPRRLCSEVSMDKVDWRRVQEEMSGPVRLVEDWSLGEDVIPVEPKRIESLLQRYVIESQVIKVAIPPKTVEVLDRLRTRMAGGATMPEIVRVAVEEFVSHHSHLIDKVAAIDREKRRGIPGRCKYVKIPIQPSSIVAIGHQSPMSGLCKVFGTTRQGVITRAITWYLERAK